MKAAQHQTPSKASGTYDEPMREITKRYGSFEPREFFDVAPTQKTKQANVFRELFELRQ